MKKFGGADGGHSWKTSWLEYISSLRSEKNLSCELQDVLSGFPFNSLEGLGDRTVVPQRCPSTNPKCCGCVRLHSKGEFEALISWHPNRGIILGSPHGLSVFTSVLKCGTGRQKRQSSVM